MGLLSGKVAIVTGGGRGIGHGITQRFLAAGAKVMIAQRTRPDSSIAASGDLLAYHKTDMANAGSIAALVPATVSRFGRLDVLVNNAGIVFELSVEQTGEDDWDRLLDVNLKGPFLLTKSAVGSSQGVWSREHYQHKFHRWRGSKSAARRLLCFEVGA